MQHNSALRGYYAIICKKIQIIVRTSNGNENKNDAILLESRKPHQAK